MRFLFSTGSLWSYSVERCFAFAAAAGFDGVELLVDQRWETRQATFAGDLIRRFGLPVVAVHAPFWPVVPGWPTSHVERLLESAALAAAIGAEVVVHHLPARLGRLLLMVAGRFVTLPIPLWRAEEAYRRWLETDYAALQRRVPVTLCIENMPAYRRLGRRWNLYHWNNPQAMMRFPALTMDTTHLGTWGLEPLAVFHRWQGKVAHVHLSNYDGREHRLPQNGDLRLGALLAAMVRVGYKGAVTLEVHPETLAAGATDDEVLVAIESCLAFCRRSVTADAAMAERGLPGRALPGSEDG